MVPGVAILLGRSVLFVCWSLMGAIVTTCLGQLCRCPSELVLCRHIIFVLAVAHRKACACNNASCLMRVHAEQ